MTTTIDLIEAVTELAAYEDEEHQAVLEIVRVILNHATSTD